MQRKQFTFYRSFWEAIEKLPTNKEKLQAYQAVCGFALDEKEPDPNTIKPTAATVFCVIRPTLETAQRKATKMVLMNKSQSILADGYLIR